MCRMNPNGSTRSNKDHPELLSNILKSKRFDT